MFFYNFIHRPSSFIKEEMAKAILVSFPSLKDPKGVTGYVSTCTRNILKYILFFYLPQSLKQLHMYMYISIVPIVFYKIGL